MPIKNTRTKPRHALRVERLEPREVPSTFYVAPAGDDAAAGSAAAPWRTLQHAADVVNAGDTVIVRAGSYAGLHLTRDGTAAAPITFRGEPGAVVNTRNPVTPHGINLEGADYVVVEGFTVTGQPRAGIRSVLNHHVTIRNNTADQNTYWGILTGFSDDLLIENNTTTRSQIEHGIYVSNSGDRPVIRNNVIWGNRANGIHMNGDLSQGGDGVISGALVEGNVIYDNGAGGGSGINCDGVQDSRIQNNLLYNNRASGISLYRIDGGDGSKRNVVVNNTVVQSSVGRWALNIQSGSTGNTVYNNILYNNHSFRGSIDVSADSLPGFTSNYNVVMDRLTTNGGSSVLTLAQWRSATGQDANSVVAAPAALFVDVAGNDYHLSPTSPARDAGTSLQAPGHDLEGNPRPGGATWDVGSYEYQTGAPPPPPPPPPPAGLLDFSAASFNVTEGGLLTVTVTRTAGSTGAATVAFATADDTAAAGSDYTGVSGTLSFGPGETGKTFTVATADDGFAKHNRRFRLTLSNPTGGAALGNLAAATASIQDNDLPAVADGPRPGNLGQAAAGFAKSREQYDNLVTTAYRRYLKRDPEPAGLRGWTDLLLFHGLTEERLEAGFIGSAEYIAGNGGRGRGWVVGMYRDLLGRDPAESEVQAWLTALAGGVPEAQVAFGFAASAERQGQRVRRNYNLYLLREPTAQEVAAWVDLFVRGLATNQDIVAGFVGSPEYYGNAQKGRGNRAAWVASAYAEVLFRWPSRGEVEAWLGALA